MGGVSRAAAKGGASRVEHKALTCKLAVDGDHIAVQLVPRAVAVNLRVIKGKAVAVKLVSTDTQGQVAVQPRQPHRRLARFVSEPLRKMVGDVGAGAIGRGLRGPARRRPHPEPLHQ